jgi:hypothetical protein
VLVLGNLTLRRAGSISSRVMLFEPTKPRSAEKNEEEGEDLEEVEAEEEEGGKESSSIDSSSTSAHLLQCVSFKLSLTKLLLLLNANQ